LGVIRAHCVVIQQEESGAGVSNTGHGLAVGLTASDGIAAGGEAPETLAAINGGVGDGTGVLGSVNEAEVVLAILTNC
jgi:hypothetical protein